MKKNLLITFLSLSLFVAKAQTKSTGVPELGETKTKESNFDARNTTNTEPVFTAVEREPIFDGGLDKFYTYLQQNIMYPITAAKKNIQGKVFISFVVEMDGSLTNIRILRGIAPDIDAEAVRVIGNSPKWLPGYQNKKPVRVQYAMPIIFKLPPPEVLKEQLLMDSIRNVPKDLKIFTAVEHVPTFPGGIDAFFKYVKVNLKYPDEARAQNIEGKVFVSFVVEKDGSLTEIHISKSLSKETDEEAIRLIRNSPLWEPGMQNGRPVRVAYTIPVAFFSN